MPSPTRAAAPEVSLSELAPEAALRRLELQIVRRLDGFLHGEHLGLLPGPGTDLAEARFYVPGEDDVRRMDWAVTARTTIPHVRDVIADRELETWSLVDLSPSMHFGTAALEKRDLAVAAVATMGLLTFRVGDRFGALVLRDVHFRFPASLMEPALALREITLNGAISGVVSEAALRNGFVESATGNARWSEAGVSGQAEARFADILGEFAAAPGGGIAGHAKDDGTGNLAVDATFRAAVTGFDAEAILRARNDDPQVEETLRHVGEPQADGSSKLVVRGRMFKLY